MTMNVDEVLDALKKRFDAENDADLAKKLRVDKSTVSSWRSRGRVPNRYSDLLNGGLRHFADNPPVSWTLHERLAHDLALYKFARFTFDVIQEGDYRDTLEVFTHGGWFWHLMSNCLKEIIGFADETGHDFRTAQAILLHDYVNGQRSLEEQKELYLSMGFLRDKKSV